MDPVAAIRRDSDRFYQTADDADPSAAVQSCPGWTIADLVWHLGEVHWFWSTDIELRATGPDEVENAAPERPDAYRDLVAWGRVQADRLIGLLDSTDDDVAVWTWAMLEDGRNVGFVRRHQVQEAAVHRWDIQAASSGSPDPIESDVAVDALDEMLAVTLPWGVRPDQPLPGTVHLHCTDSDGEWFVDAGGRVETIHAKGDVALRGTASDLLLALYSRLSLGDLDIVGDESLAHDFVARISTD